MGRLSDMFFDTKKAKSDALTELLHRYLEFVYQEVLRWSKDKVWMREGDLDKPLGGKYPELTLRALLCDAHTAKRDMPNIFVFRGEKGDGRRFFIRKMIETCYESIHHMGWKQAQDQEISFRFPVYVPARIAQELKGSNLIELACQCFIQQMELTDKEQKTARKLITGLGSMGKLAVFFEEETNNHELINQLDAMELEYQPIAVFTELPEFEFEERDSIYCIRLEPLTASQIIKYLIAELPEQYSYKEAKQMLHDEREVEAILSKPEWMQLHIRMVRQNPGIRRTNTVNQIYDTFLSAQIDLAYERQGQKFLSKDDLEAWLIQQAKSESSQISETDEQYRKCFAKTDVFRSYSADFRFEGCKYYLIAKSYMSKRMTPRKVKGQLVAILKKEDLMVLKFFAGLCIARGRNQNVLFKELIHAVDDPEVVKKYSEPASLLAEVLTFTNRVGADGPELVKWACLEMQKSTYDTSVLVTLSRLNQANPNAAITNLLTEQYIESKNARVKRRIVYCFGCMGQGYFPDLLINELCAADPPMIEQEKRHLQYHISAALVDNCEKVENLREHFPDLERALSQHPDPILRSDFDTLYTWLNNPGGHLGRNGQNQCEDQLIKMLEEGQYWQKAHAAGALGRRSYGRGSLGLQSVVAKLTQTLDKTLASICQSGDEKSLKTVSYIVEACCQLARNNDYCKEVIAELRERLESQLNELPSAKISIVSYKHLQVALKLVDTGLRCLLDGTDSIRTELGMCFSSKDSLVQSLSYHCRREQDSDWQGLKEAIFRLEKWSSPEGAKLELKNIYHEQIKHDRKLYFSLTYLRHEDEAKMAGFLFLLQNDIYFITCRHCFFNGEENTIKAHPFVYDPEQISFSPACLDASERYHGIMCYPKDLFEPSSFDKHADDDIVIYRLLDIPASFSQIIFSEKDVPDAWKVMEESQLESFSFPITSRTQGKWISGSGYKIGAHGFFTMRTSEKLFKRVANWFSGVPIIQKASNVVVGMWKSSKEASGEILGIDIRSILDKLTRITKDGGGNYE